MAAPGNAKNKPGGFALLAGILLSSSLSLVSCKGPNIIGRNELRLAIDYCIPGPTLICTAAPVPARDADSSLTDSILSSNRCTEKDVLIAKATGTIELLKKAFITTRDTSIDRRLTRLELKSRILAQITPLTLQVEAFVAQLSCEVERLKQIALYLANKSKSTNNRLIVSSIITGSVTTTAPVWIKGSGPQNTIAITGGLLSAVFGALSLHPATKKVKLYFDKNLFHDIWFQPDSSVVFSPSLWCLLTATNGGAVPGISLVQNIRLRWFKFDLNNTAGPETEELLFGKGGVYGPGELATRSEMAAELMAAFQLVSYHLNSFRLFVNDTIYNASTNAR